MKTTRIAQYAALAANNSCLAAFVSSDMAALKSNVKTISKPTALRVSLVLESTAVTEELNDPASSPTCSFVEVSIYIATTGTTSRAKMMRVMRMLASLSMRVELYKVMYLSEVFARSSGDWK